MEETKVDWLESMVFIIMNTATVLVKHVGVNEFIGVSYWLDNISNQLLLTHRLQVSKQPALFYFELHKRW